MGYRKEIYQKAVSLKNNAIKKAQAEYEARFEELKRNSEELRDIEDGLERLGPAIALAAISSDSENFEKFRQMADTFNTKKKQLLLDAGVVKPEHFCKKCLDEGHTADGWCDCINDIAKSLVAEELSRYMPIGDCSFETFNLNYYSDKADEKGRIPQKRAAAILKSARNFVSDFPKTKSLLFMGETGLGKTHLSLAIVSAVSEKGYSVIYGPAGKLFTAAEKEHFSYSGETEKLDSMLSCDLLVIDDLGTEFLSSFTSSLFYNIVNSRILENKPTVISTNLTIDEIEKRYSSRIASRFIGNYDTKMFIGDDIRQKKAYE